MFDELWADFEFRWVWEYKGLLGDVVCVCMWSSAQQLALRKPQANNNWSK